MTGTQLVHFDAKKLLPTQADYCVGGGGAARSRCGGTIGRRCSTNPVCERSSCKGCLDLPMNRDKVGLSVAIAIALLAGAARAQTEPAAPAAPAGAPPAVAPPAEGVPSSPLPPPVPVAPASVAPAPAAPPAEAAVSDWRASFYGFAEDRRHVRHDAELGPASNNNIARASRQLRGQPPAQPAHGQQLAGRRAPGRAGLRQHSHHGTDRGRLFGAQPTDATEATTFTTPALRLGCSTCGSRRRRSTCWSASTTNLFAWGGQGFYQNSVAFLGVAGESITATRRSGCHGNGRPATRRSIWRSQPCARCSAIRRCRICRAA